MPGPPVNDCVARMLQMAAGSPARLDRRNSSWEQKKVPSSTIWVTARQPLGLRSSAGTGKLAGGLLRSTPAGPRTPPPHCFHRGGAGPTVTLVARQDPDRGAQAAELDGDGLAEAGPAAG